MEDSLAHLARWRLNTGQPDRYLGPVLRLWTPASMASEATVAAYSQQIVNLLAQIVQELSDYGIRCRILSELRIRVPMLPAVTAPIIMQAALSVLDSDHLPVQLLTDLFQTHGTELDPIPVLSLAEMLLRNINSASAHIPGLIQSVTDSGHIENMQSYLPLLMPLIMKILNMPGADLIPMQIQLFSLLVHWVRSPLHEAISSIHDLLTNVARQLLVIAPSNDRRLVLDSVRSLVEGNARLSLYRQLDHFLDFDILKGHGCSEEIVAIAHDTLCAIVTAAATDQELKSMEQLTRVIHVFCVHILDRTASIEQQKSSLRIIFILVDNVFRVGTGDVSEASDTTRVNEERRSRGRAALIRVLQTLVMKFESIANLTPGLIQAAQSAPIEEAISVLQMLIHDLQTLLWRISNISAGPGAKASWMFKIDECRLVSRLLHSVVSCFPLLNFCLDQQPNAESDTESSSPFAEPGMTSNVTCQSPAAARTAAFLEKFANVFVSLDQASFRRVIGLDIGILFEALVQHPRLPQLVVPQQFLGNPSVSKIFADIVMLYLLERLNDMAAPTLANLKALPDPTEEDRRRSATALLLLNLFRVVAGSLSLYADNEEALQPYMPRLIRKSIRQALIVRYKHHYLWMLRHMFRSIGGGKFQRLYQTFVPLLPELLSGLHRLQEQDYVDLSVRELAVELSLTVPARLSTLLTFIPLMMKSVVRALQSADEQVVKVGLRTFEFWVDKLNHDYLFDHLSGDICSAMRALCALLKPTPAPFGSVALLLLGKLGGRNRRFLVETMDIPYSSNVHEGLPLRVNAICGNRTSLSMTSIAELVVSRISSGTSLDSHALPFLQSLIAILFQVPPDITFPLEQLPQETPRPAPTRSEPELVTPTDTNEQEMVLAFRRRPRFDALDSAAQTLFLGLFTLASRDHAAFDYLERLSRFFAFVDTDRVIFLKSLVYCLTTPAAFTSTAISNTVLSTMASFLDEMSLLYGVDETATSAAVDVLLQKFAVICQDRSIIMRSAGVSGLSVLCARLPPRWLQTQGPDIIDALMATLSEEIVSFQQTRWFDPENEVDDFFTPTGEVGLDADDPPIQSQSALHVMQVAEETLQQVIEASTVDSVLNGALTTRFAAFLTDPSWFARNVALRCLERISALQGVSAAAILDAHLPALAEPVLQRTLAKVAPSMRVGHVWSAALALRLNPNLAPADQLATVVADAIENIKSGRAARTKGRDVVRLQVEYISLMSITVSCTSLSWNDDLRNAVVQSLFNAMVDRSSGVRVVNAAKRGLAMLCRQHKMPKTLLRNCLEPVLRNLAEPPTLSMPLLTLLEHLLQLLAHCFNVTLGRTLLDHLFFFSEALKQMLTMPQASVSLPAIRQPGDEIRLPCRLLDLFHRLPPAPRQFLTKLVMAVVSLESMLPLLRAFGGHGVGHPSPFRAPLMRFICTYAAESVAFFLTPKNLVDRRLSQLFLEILSSEEGATVCDTLIALSDQLLAASFNIEQSQQTQTNQMQSQRRSQQSMDSMQIDEGSEETEPAVPRRAIPEKAVEELELQGVNIVYQLSHYSPSWLGQTDASRVVDALANSWMSPASLPIGADTPIEKVIKRQRLAHCLVTYWNAKMEQSGANSQLPTNILWMLLSAVDCRAIVDFSFLHRFFSIDVAVEISSARLQQIARDFFSNVLPASSPYSDLERKAGLRSLIIPAFKQRSERGVRVAAFNLLMPRLFESCLDERHSWQVRELIIQLLCELLEKDPDLVRPNKYIHPLIAFARSNCEQKAQIPISFNLSALRLLVMASVLSKEVKRSAYLGLYVRCLRTAALHKSESARHAMDTLAEFFHEHWEQFPSDPLETPHENSNIFVCPNDDEFLLLELLPSLPEWLGFLSAFALRSTANAREVCGHVLRLAPIFSHHSQCLCDALAGSLTLLRSDAVLVVDMTEQLVSWNVSVSGPSSPKRQKVHRRVSSRSSSPRIIKGSSWTASLPSITSIVNALLHVYATYANHPPSTEAPLKRLLATIALVAREWPHASFAAVDKFSDGRLEADSLRTLLLLLDTLLSARDLAFLQETPERLSVFDRVICRLFEFPDVVPLLDPFLALLRRLESLVPVADSSPELYAGLHNAIQNGVQQKDVFVLHLALASLEIISSRSPAYMMSLNPALSAAFHTLARRCLANRPAATKQNPAMSGVVNDSVALLCATRLIANRAQHLREQRKQILSTVANLIEKCDDVMILRDVVKMTCSWISAANGALPDLSIKEKVGLLVRLSRIEESFDDRDVIDCINGAVLSILERHENANAMIRVELFRGLARPILGLLRSGSPSMFQRMITAIHTWAGSSILSRLQFLLEYSGWSAVHDRYWLAPGNELILSIILSTQPLQLCADSTTLIEIGDLKSQQSANRCLSTMQTNSLLAHSEFASELVHFDPTPFVTALSRITLVDDELAEMTFLNAFPLAWAALDPVERSQLCSIASRLLPRDDLLKQTRCRPNTVVTLLSAFERSEQAVELRPELLSYLGRTYGVWHSASRLLERQIFSGIEDHLAIRALVELQNDLNERDVVAGIYQVRCSSAFTGAAMALEQYGLWPRAQEEFYNAMRSIHEPGSDAVVPIADESLLWEQEWLKSSRYLHQWSQLGDVFAHLSRPDLVIESASLSGDAVQLEKLLEPYSLDSQPTVSIKGLLYRLQVLLHQQAQLVLHLEDNKNLPGSSNDEIVVDGGAPVPQSVALQRITIKQNTTLDRSIDVALQEWSRRPSMIGNGHVDLLARFQQLVEMRECRVMLEEAGKSWKANRIPDFKNGLTSWRDRLPNPWDSVIVWNEIMTTRMHVFNRLLTAFRPLSANQIPDTPPHNDLINLADPTWTIVKMAETARRQQLPQVCLTWLTQLLAVSPNSLSPADAFAKIREQVRVCMQSADEIRSAVSLLNLSSMERFTPEQCAELFRLKGEALEHLGLGEDSHTAFSSALAISDDYGKGWLSWGAFCDQLFGLQKDRQWAEYTISCYLQAVRFHSSDKARLMLARVLWLMSYDKNDGPLNSVFKKYAADLPVWVWLLWLPQLIASLPRHEGTAFTAILQNVARAFPQALYYGIRAYLHERRDLQRMQQTQAQGSDPMSPNSNAEQPAERSAANVRAVVTALRTQHLNLVAELEKMLEEFGRCFRPEPQEELLSTVQALFVKCFRQPITHTDTVPESLTDNVRRVCSKFFMQSVANCKPILKQFVEHYREKFLKDFLPPPEGTDYPLTLTRLMRRLKWWKSYLRYSVAQSHRDERSRQLIRLSPYLARFEARHIEVPGQYGHGHEPRPGSHIMLERFTPTVGIVRHNGMSFRRIGFIGSDGGTTYFLVQFFVAHITKSDERMMQMTRILNQLMLKSRETRERNMCFSVPSVIPLTNRLRLFESDLSVASLDSVLEHMCFLKNMDADDALTVYRNQLGGVVDDQRDAARHNVHRRIMQLHIPTNTFSTYIEKSLGSYDALWAFKMEFTKQLGLTSFLTFALRIGDRAPHKIWFSRKSGRIMQTDFYPSYSSSHMIDHQESVPFRLTPNFTEFCTPFLIEGVFSSAFISSAACWLRRQHIVKNYLNLYLRDDLVSWSVTLSPATSDNALDELEKQLRPMVSANTSQILARVQSLMPTTPPPNEASKLPLSINAKIQRLVESSTSIDNLSAMPPTWHPWF